MLYYIFEECHKNQNVLKLVPKGVGLPPKLKSLQSVLKLKRGFKMVFFTQGCTILFFESLRRRFWTQFFSHFFSLISYTFQGVGVRGECQFS